MSGQDFQELRSLLRRTCRRWQAVELMRAGSRVLLTASVCLAIGVTVDRVFEPIDSVLLLSAIATGVFIVALALRSFWPLLRAPSDQNVARYIEERYPELKDRLVSATAVTKSTDPWFYALVLEDTVRAIRSGKHGEAVRNRDLLRSGFLALGMSLIFFVTLATGVESIERISRTAWVYAFSHGLQLDVSPGDARVLTGEALEIRTQLEAGFGALARSEPSVVVTRTGGTTEVFEMNRDGGGYVLDMRQVHESFTYHVIAGPLASNNFDVTALARPEVERIEVAYEYPLSTGLKPRVELDGGDIFAPTGTAITVSVIPDKPIRSAELKLVKSGSIRLQRKDDRRWVSEFAVNHDDSYRVVLVDSDSLANRDDSDYFIRALSDQPPSIQMIRPGGDREITALEETDIEARVEDDFGVRRFDLVFTVLGRDSHVINLLPEGQQQSVNGLHTIYAESLDLKPGDFISYYTRAQDTNDVQGTGETRSDIFFLEVRAFEREFEEAARQLFSSSGTPDIDDLFEDQKDIIAATWRLDRDASFHTMADVTLVADGQAELRRLASRVVNQTEVIDSSRRTRTKAEENMMVGVVRSMEEAEIALRSNDTGNAIPAEMEALNGLLRLKTEIRRTQISQQEQSAKNGSRTRQEDLSELFDRELRSDQQTNYEDLVSTVPSQPSEPESEVLRRVRELAARQEAVNEQESSLVDEKNSLEPEQWRRQLETLAREQNAIKEQMHELERSLAKPSTNRAGRTDDAQARRQGSNGASDRMEAAQQALSNSDPARAASIGREVVEQLRSIERRVGRGLRSQIGASIGLLAIEAQKMAELQRRVSTETRREENGPSASSKRRVESERNELAERADELARRVEELSIGAAFSEQDELTRMVEHFSRLELGHRMRVLSQEYSESFASTLGAELASEIGRIVEADGVIASELDGISRELRAVTNSDQQTAISSGKRNRAAMTEVRSLLEEIDSVFSSLVANEPDVNASERLEVANKKISDASPRSDRENSELVNAAGPNDELDKLRTRLSQRLSDLSAFQDFVSPTVREQFGHWLERGGSASVPDIESWKQDFSEWLVLRKELFFAVELFELDRLRELDEGAREEALYVEPNERSPEKYRQKIDEYFRSLARRP